MKYKITYALMGLLIGGQAFAKRNVEHVNLTTMINAKRQSVKVIGSSSSKYGLVCSRIKLKIELEDPQSYMSMGEFEEQIDDVFLYPQKDERTYINNYVGGRLALVNENSEDAVIIRKVSIDQSKMRCVRANFSQYCRLAQKDLAEEFSLAQLGNKLKRSNCKSLAFKLNDTFLGFRKKLILNDTYIMDFRFLSYLDKIKTVYLNNTFRDRSGTVSHKSSQLDLPADVFNFQSYIPQEELDKAEEFSFR